MDVRDVVVLVDTAGHERGIEQKIAAHEAPGSLHRAFSVFLYRSDGALLLQQRSGLKYHFPFFWANVCCSHPGPDQDVMSSAKSRLKVELRVDAELVEVGTFIYRAVCPVSGLVEYEFDHVLIGEVDEVPNPNVDEVARSQWIRADDVLFHRIDGPQAPWLVPALQIAERARRSASFG